MSSLFNTSSISETTISSSVKVLTRNHLPCQAFVIQKRLTYLAEFIEDNYDDKQPKVILITNKNNKKLGKMIDNINEEYSIELLNLVALP